MKITVGLTDPIPQEYLPEAEATLAQYVDGPGFALLADLHGVELPPSAAHDARMAAIADMSDTWWDLRGFQGGVERQALDLNAIKWDQIPGLSDIQQEGSDAWVNTFAAAESFGMSDDVRLPENLHYSAVRYTLGATATSALPRVQLTLGHQLTPPRAGQELPPPERSNVHPALQDHSGVVIGLGTHRRLNAAEKAVAETFAPGAVNESDVMLGAFKHELAGRYTETSYELDDVGYEYDPEKDRPRVTQLSVDGGSLLALILHAPEPKVTELGRAQTPHTYAMLRTVLRELVGVQPGDDVIGVSNSIYQFQNVAGANAFGRDGLKNHFAGFGHEAVGIRRIPASFLPEFRSLELQLRYLDQAIKASK